MYKNNKIREIRNRKKITAREIAENLGLTTQAVLQYEKGIRTPSLITLGQIAAFLKCDLTEIVGGQLTNTQIFIREALKEKNTTLTKLAHDLNVPEEELKKLYDNEEGCSYDTFVKFYKSIGFDNLSDIGNIANNDVKINFLFNNKCFPIFEDKVMSDYLKRVNNGYLKKASYYNYCLNSGIDINLGRENIIELDVTDLSDDEISDIKKYIEFIRFKKEQK